MPISSKIAESLTHASWIRKMFEIGIAIKKEHGEENVFDFSLGNPDLESPPEFESALISESRKKGSLVHSYMPNAGYTETRSAIAGMLSRESGLNFNHNHIIMNIGAAGALNILFVQALQKQLILATPSTGFQRPGYIRISYCIPEHVIQGAIPGFRAVFEEFSH